ncbi:MAG: SH3 domain-containing protein [Syntrophaceae bacterium]|nr:SH3 domain-containing protein [Syntrophaceae bacterium]
MVKQELRMYTLTSYRHFSMLLIVLFFLMGCAETPPASRSSSVQPQPYSQPVEVQQTTPSEVSNRTSPAEAFPSKRMETVICKRLKLRRQPSIRSEVVLELREGEGVEIKGQTRSSVNVITSDGKDGWVDGGCLTGFPELKEMKQPSPKHKAPTPTSKRTPPSNDPKKPVSDALESEIKGSNKTPVKPKIDDSVVDQPAAMKSAPDDAKVSGPNQ